MILFNNINKYVDKYCNYISEHIEYSQSNVLLHRTDYSFADSIKYDHIIMNNMIDQLDDIQEFLEKTHKISNNYTRLYIIDRSDSNIKDYNVRNLLKLSGWDVVSSVKNVLIPHKFANCINKLYSVAPISRHLGFVSIIIARRATEFIFQSEISCSVIIPVRNESGNIRNVLLEIPQIGDKTEIIFVEGNSTDSTWDVIQDECADYDGPHIVSYYKQHGIGKWDAVRLGFDKAHGDILVIQDGDITVRPNDLIKFYNAIITGDAEFINGCRLIYPMQDNAMRFLNKIGNKQFAYIVSKIINQKIEDSLCGTKMISKYHYNQLCNLLGDKYLKDPFGDFTLIFGASLLDLKVIDIPVKYYRRSYGNTNITRFADGIKLLQLVCIYAAVLKNKYY